MNSFAPSPFEQLPEGTYFIRREPAAPVDYDASYWGTTIDPDGNTRQRISEAERLGFLANVKTELAAIHARPPGRLLDVGCGAGFLLSGVSDEWERHGVEISRLAAEEAAKWAQVRVGDLASADYPDEHFDVVVLYHVIEHLEDPVAMVARIRRLLKPDGLFIVGTPDFDCALARRFGERFRLLHDPTHVSLFSEDSLRRLLRDQGFRVEHVDHPFFETGHFTRENLERLFDTGQMSPPFFGNVVTAYARPMTAQERGDFASFIAARVARLHDKD